MEKDEIGAVLPVPAADGWKFARALPQKLLCDMSLSDNYHVEVFMDLVKSAPFQLLLIPVQDIPTDGVERV
jgi:hypothetical protein